MFQLYNLMPVLSAERNVELPLLLTKLSSAERKKNVAVALQRGLECAVERGGCIDPDVGRHLQVLLERDQREVFARHHLVDRNPDAARPHLDRTRMDVA